MSFPRSRLLIWAAIFCISVGFWGIPVKRNLAMGQTPATKVKPSLTEEEMRQFLLTAPVIKSEIAKTGVTRPLQLTLSDGKLTHDAGFQSIDLLKPFEKFDDGATEINFRDTYHFNIAAYELAKLLGLESMMPVTVERKIKGKKGSLTWWIDDVKMNERERLEKKIRTPDPDAWNNQMYRKWVFAQLVYDTDPNLTNVLIDGNWKIYMIDFSRAFRRHKDLQNAKMLQVCDRQLLERMRRLDPAEVKLKLGDHLSKTEFEALMARRDKLVAHFDQLIAKEGEAKVLY